LLAKQTKLVKWGGTFALDAKAFGEEQETSFVGDGGERFPPHFVIDQDPNVIAINRITAQTLHDAIGVEFKFRNREWGDWVELSHVTPDDVKNSGPIGQGLRDVFFRSAPFLDWSQARNVDRIIQ